MYFNDYFVTICLVLYSDMPAQSTQTVFANMITCNETHATQPSMASSSHGVVNCVTKDFIYCIQYTVS